MRHVAKFLYGFISALAFSSLAFADTSETVTTPPSVGACIPFYTLELNGPRAVRTGEEVKFEINVRNLSNCPITNLTVTYFFPNIAVFDQGTMVPNPNFISALNITRRFTWAFLEAPPGGVATITHSPTITSTQSMNMVSRVCAISVNGPPVCSDLRYAVNPPVPMTDESEELR